jgi:cytochrome c oxidase subunit 1
VAVIFFLFILWERIITARPTLFTSRLRSSIEWTHSLPPEDHTYRELPVINH